MDDKEKLIIDILYKHEEEITNGYGYFSGINGNVDDFLLAISKEIISKLKEVEQ